MVTKKPKGLGLGLEALLGPKVREAAAGDTGAAPTVLALDRLLPGRYQPRTRMDEGALYELAESIRSQEAARESGGGCQPAGIHRVGSGAA